MNRQDLELYVTGNFDGDVASLERAIAEDPAMAEVVADEARFEMLLRDAAAAATFCPACEDVVRAERCDTCGAAVRPGGYTVERVLVSNAHGRMYVARDADGKQVALKELAFVQAPTASTIEAFEREAKFLRALAHPAIPRFLASFDEGRGVHARYYLAQELVAGTELDRIDEHWYSEAEIVDIARQVLDVLVYLQSLSPMVIHRDIKPANLIKRADGKIAVVDFGAAYVDGSTVGATTVGTFGYMPTEQLAGIVDATTDLYALGASLLYLLTRQEPWRLAQSKTTPNVSAPLRAFLDKLTASDPNARFQSAKQALAVLDRRDELVVRAPRKWLRPAIIAATAALVTGSGAAVGYMLHGSSERVERPVPAPQGMATLRVALRRATSADLYVDGKMVAAVRNNTEVPISTGVHSVTLVGPNGGRCQNDMRFETDKLVTVECVLQPTHELPPPAVFDNSTIGAWSFKNESLHDVMLAIASKCSFSVVVPDHIDAKITANLAHVPCNQAFEALLDAHGLWYEYDKPANLVRIAPRRELEVRRADLEAHGELEPRLPEGARKSSLELNHVSLRDVLRVLDAGEMNVVVPDHIDGKVTIRLHEVSWTHALEAVLASQGLWYEYRENGKIIRIAPRRELEQQRR